MSETTEVKIAQLDEVEMYLGLLKIQNPELVEGRTYKQICKSINTKFGINSTEEDVFLIHEPTVDDLEEDLRVYFNSIGLIY